MLTVVPELVFAESTTPTISLDKTVYSWTDMVRITVFAPNYNLDDTQIDVIGNSIQNPITISTKHHTLDQYKLVETGPNTGVFTGYIILTGFKHDVDGYKETGDKNGYDTNPRTGDGNGTTIGLGPTNGFLENTNDDEITVSFKFSEDKIVVTSSVISWNIGKVQFLGEITDEVELDKHSVHFITRNLLIRVIDPDMNLDPESIDDFKIRASSGDPSPRNRVTVIETGKTTGIFEGKIYIRSDSQSEHVLRAFVGDTIDVRYNDYTVPSHHTTNNTDVLYIVESALFRKPFLDRMSIIDLRVNDTLNNGIVYDDITGHKPIQITADIRNNQMIYQEFVYIVQIQNSNNEIVYLDWIKDKLDKKPYSGINLTNVKSVREKDSITSLAVSWLPDDSSDTYTVTAFVWKSLVNAVPLSPKVEMVIYPGATN